MGNSCLKDVLMMCHYWVIKQYAPLIRNQDVITYVPVNIMYINLFDINNSNIFDLLSNIC